jgi:hypothetical protein
VVSVRAFDRRFFAPDPRVGVGVESAAGFGIVGFVVDVAREGARPPRRVETMTREFDAKFEANR